jgi:hypothetical protein
VARSPNGTSDQRSGGVSTRRAASAELDGGLERTSSSSSGRPAKVRRLGRGLEQRGAIGRRRGRELRVEPFEQRGEIAAAERQRAQSIGTTPASASSLQRSRQRAREPRRAGHRREVRARRRAGFERRPRRDRLGSDPRHRDGAARRQHRRREVRRELGEAEAVQADAPRRALRDSRAKSSAAPRDADDHRPAPPCVEQPACAARAGARLRTIRRCEGRDERMASRCTCPGRRAGLPFPSALRG